MTENWHASFEFIDTSPLLPRGTLESWAAIACISDECTVTLFNGFFARDADLLLKAFSAKNLAQLDVTNGVVSFNQEALMVYRKHHGVSMESYLDRIRGALHRNPKLDEYHKHSEIYMKWFCAAQNKSSCDDTLLMYCMAHYFLNFDSFNNMLTTLYTKRK